MEIVEALNRNTKFKTGLDLSDIVSQMSQTGDLGRMEQSRAANNPAFGITAGFSSPHIGTSNRAGTANLEDLANLGPTDNHIFKDRRQHALHGLFNIFD